MRTHQPVALKKLARIFAAALLILIVWPSVAWPQGTKPPASQSPVAKPPVTKPPAPLAPAAASAAPATPSPADVLSGSTAPAPTTKTDQKVIIEDLVSDGSGLSIKNLADPFSSAPVQLVVTDAVLKEQVKKLHKGDYLTINYESADKNTLKALSTDTIDGACGPTKFLTLLLSAAICFLLYYFLSGLHPKNLILGEDNRYSNSKFQTALWFGVLITSYLAVSWIRWQCGPHFVGSINIPNNLLLLSGMSAFTFAAAKGITTAKVNAAVAAGNVNAKPPAPQPNLLRDLTHNDGQPAPGGQPASPPPMLDLGDTQMVVVTLLAVTVYIAVLWNFLGAIPKTTFVSLPDVDSTILAAFGLGQGAYLAKKAVGNVSST
jgi:hypothetical protein